MEKEKTPEDTRDGWNQTQIKTVGFFFFQEIFFIDIKVVLMNLLLPLLTFDQCNLI